MSSVYELAGEWRAFAQSSSFRMPAVSPAHRVCGKRIGLETSRCVHCATSTFPTRSSDTTSARWSHSNSLDHHVESVTADRAHCFEYRCGTPSSTRAPRHLTVGIRAALAAIKAFGHARRNHGRPSPVDSAAKARQLNWRRRGRVLRRVDAPRQKSHTHPTSPPGRR